MRLPPLSRSHAIGGGAACPQDAGLRASGAKRVGDNALHPVISFSNTKRTLAAWTRLRASWSCLLVAVLAVVGGLWPARIAAAVASEPLSAAIAKARALIEKDMV